MWRQFETAWLPRGSPQAPRPILHLGLPRMMKIAPHHRTLAFKNQACFLQAPVVVVIFAQLNPYFPLSLTQILPVTTDL
jgi:hypothetical protein